jgi:hypothetical protein
VQPLIDTASNDSNVSVERTGIGRSGKKLLPNFRDHPARGKTEVKHKRHSDLKAGYRESGGTSGTSVSHSTATVG